MVDGTIEIREKKEGETSVIGWWKVRGRAARIATRGTNESRHESMRHEPLMRAGTRN